MGRRADPLTRLVIGAMYEVHNTLGVGFLESVYERATARVLRDLGLHVERQAPLDVQFRGECIGHFIADLLVEERLLVELKVVRQLAPVHTAQVLNYLRASGLRTALLANFGRRVEVRRFVL